ncbi:hypothetical protein BaRGS_00021818, partial [Batillaria attramentaria]
ISPAETKTFNLPRKRDPQTSADRLPVYPGRSAGRNEVMSEGLSQDHKGCLQDCLPRQSSISGPRKSPPLPVTVVVKGPPAVTRTSVVQLSRMCGKMTPVTPVDVATVVRRWTKLRYRRGGPGGGFRWHRCQFAAECHLIRTENSAAACGIEWAPGGAPVYNGDRRSNNRQKMKLLAVLRYLLKYLDEGSSDRRFQAEDGKPRKKNTVHSLH